jgi:hypothetical protein
VVHRRQDLAKIEVPVRQQRPFEPAPVTWADPTSRRNIRA